MTQRAPCYSFTPSKRLTRGLVQVFTGEGKGKTSAALGAVLRALGHGLRVYMVFFMKGDYPYGEFKALAQLPNVDVARFGLTSFCDPGNVRPEEIEQAKKALAAAREAILSGDYDMVVLDEVNVAAAWKLVEVDEVLKLVQDKPQGVELILTGRYADARLVQTADLVTEMVKIKHPYDAGVKSRRGIEY
ncbi:MAG: cob(I)yrinic acid a,c-diamide adenosyltransferase [Chloroflexi bacterium]|nr:cob(I)yrinic acid a,c-diamide adenosyltransferase [Chloroflexota bacterium]